MPTNKSGLILGTGPSLSEAAHLIPQFKGLVFGCNNTYQDFKLDVWLACDPAWHSHYGQVNGDFTKWHWDKGICKRYGYRYIEGRWFDGLSPVGANWISYNHCSGAQLLNLGTSIYKCDVILLVGHDFKYVGDRPRHYFKGLSDKDGEYPTSLRKFSKFDKGPTDGLVYNYKFIAEQKGLPPIINCTPDSALPWFPMGRLEDYV